MRSNKVPFCLKLVLLVLWLPVGSLISKSFSLEQIQIKAVIQSVGDMTITESRTYDFRGNFSWADYRLPLQGIGTVRHFSLRDEVGEYNRSRNEKPGTFYVEQNIDEFYVRWFYRANNEQRTFTLSYLVTDAVTRYQDVAEFYYQFVGAEKSLTIKNVAVIIKLPEPAQYPEVRAWAHGPLWGTVDFRSGEIQLRVNPLPAGQFCEARVLFPPEWIPGASRISSQKKLETILDQEDQWARDANEKRERAREQYRHQEENESRAWFLALISVAVGLLGLAILYLKLGRGSRVDFQQSISSELPESEPPAITSIIFHGKQVYGAAMTATLFDLARRGYMSIEQISLPEKRWWGTRPPEFVIHRTEPEDPVSSLLNYEQDLLDFIFQELGEGNDTVNFKTFKKRRSRVQKWFRKWRDLLKAHLKNIVYYDKASIRGTVYAVIISILVILSGVVILIYLGNPGVAAILAGIVLFSLSFTILRYTPEIKRRRLKLKALKKYLGQYHFFDERNQQAGLSNFGKYLVYGLALGLGKKEIEKMMLAVPADQHYVYIPWYYYQGGGFAAPADLASAVSTLVSVASGTVSSSTGAGGGASGGGGGGGGGASGGAG